MVTIGILALAMSIQCQPALPGHDRPMDPELLEQTIRTARSAPPEVAADILLKIVESRLETRPKQLRVLVDEALGYIGQAQEPARLRQFRGGTESIGGTLRAGFTFGLDRVSLNGRAIRVLLGPLNDRAAAVRAWEAMTNSLVLPRVETCRTDLVPDFREYFRVLEELLRASPKLEREPLLLRTLHQIRFVTQVEPAVKLLEVQEILDEGERSKAAIALASAISSLGAGNESVVANAREFTTSYPAAIAAIGSWIPSLEPASREAVISAARQMVWMGLKTGLCDDAPKTIVDPVTSKRQVRALQSPDRLFNEQIAPFSSARETPAITDRDLAKLAESSRLPQPMGAAESESTFFSPELRRLRDVHFLLSTAPTEERALVRWQEEISRFTNRVIELKHDDSDNQPAGAVKFFLAKCELLRYIATMPAARRPASMKPEDLDSYYKARASFRGQDRIPGAFLEHLRSATGQAAFRTRRLLWITQARWFLVEMARTAKQREAAAAAWIASGDPVLAAYGQFLKLAGRL
jgi:hypothetical protein